MEALEKGLRPQVLAINVSKFLPASRCSKRQLGIRSGSPFTTPSGKNKGFVITFLSKPLIVVIFYNYLKYVFLSLMKQIILMKTIKISTMCAMKRMLINKKKEIPILLSYI